VDFIRKAFAFIHRDFIEATSYKADFFFQFFLIFISVLVFYFLSKLFGSAVVSYLEPYGGDYFSFVLIGVAFTNYLETSLQSFSKSIRDAQMMGTSFYSFIWTSFHVIVYLLLGVFLFNVNISQANVLGALVILLLTITTFSSIGIISASFIMVLKKGDPIASLFGALLMGCSFKALGPNILALAIFSLVMVPLSILSFRFAVNRAKRDGSLTHY